MKIEVKRALISVTDKQGLESFAKALGKRGIEIIASGGTAAAIRKANVGVIEISALTGFPEIMDGRVKTLHPKVSGGILADRGNKEHLEAAEKLDIPMIDLVAVNLYRFREAAENPELDERDVVEQIDIGGPTLIRAAAKNHHSVVVCVDPGDYADLIDELDSGEGVISLDTRKKLASKAFHHTALYDAAISSYFERLTGVARELPDETIKVYRKVHTLRYGENPHLKGALYAGEPSVGSFAAFEQLQGKELSYNNIQDMYASFLLARDLGDNACAIIKHMNPCGAAACGNAAGSFVRARKTDPVSAFGSVVSFNSIVDEAAAEACREGFLEVIIARGFSDGARSILRKKKNLRLIIVPGAEWDRDHAGWTAREVGDLLLIQERDEGFPELEKPEVVTAIEPGERELAAMKLAWKVAKHIRSNAIVICDRHGTIGVGAGQMSRVDSCRIAVDKARREGLEITGASAASDAFFPFPDGVEVLADAGIKSIIQPGGSMRDEEIIKAADELKLAMVLTGRRHFRH